MTRASVILTPLTPLYRAVVAVRRVAYDRGWARTHRLPLPVVSVGNLTFGGTGKTPTVIALAENLVARGRHPAVVTRGYGRSTDGSLLLFGREELPSAERAGDEPVEIARRLPEVPVIVDDDRVRGGDRASGLGADVVNLDDGFQHLRVARDLNLVVVDAGDPWGGGRLPPLGRLREPVTALARATAVLVTKVGRGADGPPAEIVDRVREINPDAPILAARLLPTKIHREGSVDSPKILEGRRVVAMAGLGRPEGFRTLLEDAGADVVECRWFADHHAYDRREVDEVRELARRLDAVVATTAKDAVKLEYREGVWVVEAAMRPVGCDWSVLWSLVGALA